MAKTAEEIIHEQIGIKPGAKPVTPMDHGECLRCMREFAAQEVEEYKKRIEQLEVIIRSDSVYTLLCLGYKSPSSSGVDSHDCDLYIDLYNISTELRKKQIDTVK